MNVIILSDFAIPNGGSQKVAIESAVGLAEQGVSVDFVHAIAGRDARLDHPAITCRSLDLPDVWAQPPLQAAGSGIWNAAAGRRVGAILAKPDRPRSTLIHIHQWTRAFSPAIFKAALASPFPVVVTAHDYFLSCPNGVYYRFERQEPCSKSPLSLGCLAARCDPRSSAHKAIRVLRSAATSATLSGKALDVVHVSDRGRETLAPLLPPGFRHHRLDNPVTATKGTPAEIVPGAPFAYVGRLTPEKGAVVAAEAARLAGAPILFVGDGPADAAIRTANPEAQLLGWRSRDEVEALVRGGITAIVAPSQWYETGPLTVYEAAAAGVASIASDRCGAAERVDASCGRVVVPSAAAIAGAMRELREPEVAQRLGHAAYDAYWARPLDAATHARGLIALYDTILARPA